MTRRNFDWSGFVTEAAAGLAPRSMDSSSSTIRTGRNGIARPAARAVTRAALTLR